MEKDVDVLTVKQTTMQNCDFPADTLNDWLQKVNNVKMEVEVIDKKYQKRHRYIYFICSDYNISRNAAKKLSDVKSLSDNQIINNFIGHA